MSKTDKDFLVSGESILVTTFYTYGSQLIITNKRLMAKRQSRIPRQAFEGEILWDDIIDVQYLPGIPLLAFSDPGILIEHKLADGTIVQSRIKFQGGESARNLIGYTSKQVYELIQNVLNQSADGDGFREPDSSIVENLTDSSKRARRIVGAMQMATVFVIAHALISFLRILVDNSATITDVASLFTSSWEAILLAINILLLPLLLGGSVATIVIYFLPQESYRTNHALTRWAIVGVAHALIWQVITFFVAQLVCWVSILLWIVVAIAVFLLVFKLLLPLRNIEETPNTRLHPTAPSGAE